MVKTKRSYIFESPDGGDTVFRHEFGKPETKELVKVGDEDLLDIVDDYELAEWSKGQYTWADDNDAIFDEEWEESFKQEVTWKDIKAQAETHPALKEIVDQMMTLYHLSKEDEDNNNGI